MKKYLNMILKVSAVLASIGAVAWGAYAFFDGFLLVDTLVGWIGDWAVNLVYALIALGGISALFGIKKKL